MSCILIHIFVMDNIPLAQPQMSSALGIWFSKEIAETNRSKYIVNIVPTCMS